MLLINSSMLTVLPTPAPPKRPILPPLANGQIRSTTLMPVSSSSTDGDSSSNLGAAAWIERRSVAFTGPLSSIGRPSTSITRPSVAGPTGTEIGAPVLFTRMPRRRPSVEPSAMVRTTPSPSCCSTSKVRPFSAKELPSSTSVSASYTRGIASRGNWMSMTAPMDWTILPSLTCVVLMIFSRECASDGCSAAHDFRQFLGDGRLARLVVDEREVVDDAGGVLARRLHRDHARRLLARHVLGDRLVDDLLDITRQQLVQHGARVRLVDVVPVRTRGLRVVP